MASKAEKSEVGDRFSGDRLSRYRDINGRLVIIEKGIKQDFKRLLPQRERMRKDGIIEDFKIELEVSVWLDESDLAYRDDSDNILAVSSYNTRVYADSDFGLDDGQNHNECRHFDGHPMKHELYDHSRLWEGILRLNMIWLDTTVKYQNFYYLKKDRQARSKIALK